MKERTIDRARKHLPHLAYLRPAVVRVAVVMSVIVMPALTIAGCALQPVQPWEKGDLAKPAMGFSMDPLDDRFTQHIYNSKENASGGYAVGGGGCGCN